MCMFQQNIIQSLLDTDFYKFTMMQAVLHNYPNTEVEWEFKCRTTENLAVYQEAIKEHLQDFEKLTIDCSQIEFLSKFSFIKADFLRFLTLFRFNLNYVDIYEENNQLCIKVKGPWLHVILFEVPLLALVSEVRNRHKYKDIKIADAENSLYKHIKEFKQDIITYDARNIRIADFGTRRRFSYGTQRKIIEIIQNELDEQFVGTSNMHIAHLTNAVPIGTMAHEWFMAHQQLGSRLIDSQKAALECWSKEYRGELGIALTDCITMDAFVKDFDLYFAKLFDGLRHDSSDGIAWANKAIDHYKKLGIDPKTKTLVFSDNLDFKAAINIYKELKDQINLSFGIGTKLTNNIEGVKALNIVIKMVRCNGQPVAKISDEPSKTQGGDEGFIRYLKSVFNVV